MICDRTVDVGWGRRVSLVLAVVLLGAVVVCIALIRELAQRDHVAAAYYGSSVARQYEHLLSELESGDPVRIDGVKRYLREVVQADLNYTGDGVTLAEVHKSYKEGECPERGDLFGRLVVCLGCPGASRGLTRREAKAYLGEPDAEIATAAGELLQYAYTWRGQPWVAHVCIQGDLVSWVSYNRGIATNSTTTESKSP